VRSFSVCWEFAIRTSARFNGEPRVAPPAN
jgi:hypothetical protein